jgi:hypothetical protein
MAYTIFNTRNNEVTVVEDGTIDNTTDLKLIGKNYSGYGEIQNENFVYLLENFAGANQPPRPIAGQLWFDTDDGKIKLYDGNAESAFVPLGNLHIGALPTGAAITAANVTKGDLWWDDVTSQLYAHNGASSGDPFVLIGPKGSQDVLTDLVEASVYDNLLVDGDPSPEDHEHKILKGYLDNKVVFIASNDEFTLDNSNAISGFDRIKKGITLVNTEIANGGVTQDNYNFWGTASNASQLGGVAAAEYVQRTNPVFTTQVNIADNDGLLIGPNDEAVLRVVGNKVELLSQINGAAMDFKVKNSGGSIITPFTLTATGPMPATDNAFDIGSSSLRWNEVYAVNFRGIADNANKLLSDGTFKSATRLNTVDTVVTRDSVGDIYGTSFRGTHLYNSNDASAALTGRVTRSDSVNVEGTTDYVNADTAATANKLALRDSSGNITANQFNGLATRTATVRVPTAIAGNYEYRSAPVAVRDNAGRLHAAEFIGALNGTANTATQLTTPRIISLSGDVTGSVSFDGTNDVDISVTASANSVALGTDTSGNYVESIAAKAGENYLNVYVNNVLGAGGRESAVVTLNLDADSANQANTLVARDANSNIVGSVITADTKFVGHINESGTNKDGFFDNLTVSTLNVGTITGSGVTAIANGGTGATTASGARNNLSIYSKAEIDSITGGLSSDISNISTNSIVSGSTSATVSAAAMNVTIAGAAHSVFNTNGITLSQGEFVGVATQAEYADLAEKYTTESDLPVGTVVEVCEHEDHEMDLATPTGIVAGVISDKPAYLMNASSEGQAVALKGRVPVRIHGPVKKGEAVYVYQNGLASASGEGDIVGVALESNSGEEEKLVECYLKV